MPKTTEQHLIVRSGKFEAEVIIIKDCAVEAKYWQRRSIAWLLCDSRATCYKAEKINWLHINTRVTKMYIHNIWEWAAVCLISSDSWSWWNECSLCHLQIRRQCVALLLCVNREYCCLRYRGPLLLLLRAIRGRNLIVFFEISLLTRTKTFVSRLLSLNWRACFQM